MTVSVDNASAPLSPNPDTTARDAANDTPIVRSGTSAAITERYDITMSTVINRTETAVITTIDVSKDVNSSTTTGAGPEKWVCRPAGFSTASR